MMVSTINEKSHHLWLRCIRGNVASGEPNPPNTCSVFSQALVLFLPKLGITPFKYRYSLLFWYICKPTRSVLFLFITSIFINCAHYTSCRLQFFVYKDYLDVIFCFCKIATSPLSYLLLRHLWNDIVYHLEHIMFYIYIYSHMLQCTYTPAFAVLMLGTSI